MMPSLVAHPVGIYFRIVTRLVAVDTRAMMADVDRASALASATDRGRAMQVPDAHPEAKILLGERADRANMDHVAGVLIIHRLARIDVDLVVIAAIENRQLACMRDL